MITIQQTERFAKWLSELKNLTAKIQILRRLKRIEGGNLGDTKSVGDGVHEIRIHTGPGYRIYYTYQGEEIIFLLSGGDKDSQDADIVRAKEIAKEIENGNDPPL